MRLRYKSTIPLLLTTLLAASALAAGLWFFFLRSRNATGEDAIMATVIEKSAAAADHDQSKEENSERVEFRCEVKDGTTIISLTAEGDTVRGPDVRRANIGGYIELLQHQQRIRNQEINVSQLREALAQFKGAYEAERSDFLQVQQVRSDLYREQCVLLDLKTTYDKNLIAFKIELELPPDSMVKIEDNVIASSNLIDGELNEPRERLAALQSLAGQTVAAILDLIPEGDRGIKWSKDLAEDLARLKTIVAGTEKVRASIISNNVPRARRDIEHLTRNMNSRVETLNRLRARVEKAAEQDASLNVEPAVLDPERIQRLPDEYNKLLETLQRQFDRLKSSLDKSASAIDDLVANGSEMTPEEILGALQNVFVIVPSQLDDLSALTLELMLIQFQARTESADQGLSGMNRNTSLGFELRRQLVLTAIEEVLLVRFRLQEPPRPDQFPGASQQLGAATARDLVRALSDLRDAQNDFVNLWVKYETLRRTAPETESKR